MLLGLNLLIHSTDTSNQTISILVWSLDYLLHAVEYTQSYSIILMSLSRRIGSFRTGATTREVRTRDTCGAEWETASDESRLPDQEGKRPDHDDIFGSTEARLVNNLEAFNAGLQNGSLIVKPASSESSDDQIRLLWKPTASELDYKLMNPYIYRGIHRIGSVEVLAHLLGTPPIWELKFHELIETDTMIRSSFEEFHSLPPETPEGMIEGELISLVVMMATKLGVCSKACLEGRVIVGGFLANANYVKLSSFAPARRRSSYCMHRLEGSSSCSDLYDPLLMFI